MMNVGLKSSSRRALTTPRWSVIWAGMVALTLAAVMSPAVPTANAAPVPPVVDSSGVSVPGCKLPYSRTDQAFCPGADLSPYDLSAAPFTGVNWSNAIFEQANMEGRTFPDDTDFFGDDFVGANLRSVTAMKSTFNNSDLQMTDATGATFAGAQMWSINAQRASFVDTDLTNVEFRNADLTGADFTGADLTGAFIYGDITNADFSDAIGVNLTGSTGVPDVGPPGYTPPPPPPPLGTGPISLSATVAREPNSQDMLRATWTNTSSTSSFSCTYDAHSTDSDWNYNNFAPYIGPTINIPPSSVIDQVENAGIGPLGVEWQCTGGNGEIDSRLLATVFHGGVESRGLVTLLDPDVSVPPPVVPNPGSGSSDLSLFGSS